MFMPKYYDKTKRQPVIMSSICTGEKIAGFKNLDNGRFEDIMLIKCDKDFKKFLKSYAIDEKDVINMW